MRRFTDDFAKIADVFNGKEPIRVMSPDEILFSRIAGGRLRSCMSSRNLDELATVAGEAQDAEGKFITRHDDIGPGILTARQSVIFKAEQRNMLRQMELEASVL